MSKTTILMFVASMLVATNVANAAKATNASANKNSEKTTCKRSSCEKKEKAIQLNKFKDNWFVGVGGGINTYYGNHTSYVPFGRRISPTFNVQVGKWFSPIIAFRGNFAWSNTISADLDAYNPNVYAPYKNAYKTKSDMISLNVETLFDLTNLIFGYNEKRVYSFIPYVGAGWIRNCESKGDKATASIGLINQFKVNDKFALNLDVKASAFGEGLDLAVGGPGKTGDMTTSITVGATYFFKKRNFSRAQYSNCEIKHLQHNLKQLHEEKEALEKELALAKNVQPVVKEVIKKQYASSDLAVFFAINKADLNTKDKVNLGFVADMIKNHSDKTFLITGYADKATGSIEYNDKLSEKRAMSVYDILVNEFNVNANQLEIDHMGGVDNMYYDNQQLSRVAIIRMK